MPALTGRQVAQYAYDAGFRGGTLVAMVAIAWAESGWNPGAVNPSSGATGLWQILPSAHPEFAGWNLTDPAVNARAAYRVWKSAPDPGRITTAKWSGFRSRRYTEKYFDSQIAAAQLQASGSPGAQAGPGSALPGAGETPTPTSGLSAVGDFLGSLSDPRTWLRVAYGAIGIALIIGGVQVLARPVIRPVTKVATKVATKGAVS